MKKEISRVGLILYCIIFYLIWTLFELYIKPQIASPVIRSGVIKNLVWTLPACLLIDRYSASVKIGLREMFTTKLRFSSYLPIFLLFTVYVLASSFLQTGRIAISPGFGYANVITVLFVGLTEEMVFRGWLLNVTVREEKPWPAIGLNALMFLLIHFPVWYYRGELFYNIQSLGFLSILILSVIFSMTFLKSKNILIPIALHMYWDLLVFLLL